MIRAALLALALAALAPAHAAEPIVPGIAFDVGGRSDRGFNQSAERGAARFRDETGIDFRATEAGAGGDRDAAIRRLVEGGATDVVAVGFGQAAAVTAAARAHPSVRFTIVDARIDAPNVRSVLFKEQEGSFLAGIIAAKASRSGRIGFVGGMDIPVIRAFACGYRQGARHANGAIDLVEAMTGTTPAAFDDPARGARLAAEQFDQGVDVIFAAAGRTGLAVLQAARDHGRLAIGVDVNQNHLHPGTVLTSMVKRVDVAVYDAFRAAREGTWRPSTVSLGLSEQAVSLAFDDANAPLVSPAMRAAVYEAAEEIIEGRIVVADYRQANACPP
ncbi:MAG: BMP family protein [Alphaproteobacteria bacterium]